MTGSGRDAYTVANREDAIDVMAHYPEYGEQRWYTTAVSAERVSFSWRRMLPGTGGRGSYEHRHPGQEDVYFVISGVVTSKIDDDVFRGRRSGARRVGARRSGSLLAVRIARTRDGSRSQLPRSLNRRICA